MKDRPSVEEEPFCPKCRSKFKAWVDDGLCFYECTACGFCQSGPYTPAEFMFRKGHRYRVALRWPVESGIKTAMRLKAVVPAFVDLTPAEIERRTEGRSSWDIAPVWSPDDAAKVRAEAGRVGLSADVIDEEVPDP